MKTKEIPFSTIQKVKHNNTLFEKLDQIDKLLTEIHFKYDVSEYYEDEDDDCINYLIEFWHLVEKHQNALIKESKLLLT